MENFAFPVEKNRFFKGLNVWYAAGLFCVEYNTYNTKQKCFEERYFRFTSFEKLIEFFKELNEQWKEMDGNV